MSTLRSSKFIFLTIKPFANRLLLMFAVLCALLITTTAHSSTAMMIFLGVGNLFYISSFLCLYAFYTFEKVPQLYMVLPQRKIDFVKGIYFNFLLLISSSFVIGLIASLFINHNGGSSSNFLILLGLLFFAFVLVNAIQLPLAFIVGYAKVRMFFLFIIVIGSFILTSISSKLSFGKSTLLLVQHQLLQLNHLALVALFFVASLACLSISFGISAWVYQHRDIK